MQIELSQKELEILESMYRNMPKGEEGWLFVWLRMRKRIHYHLFLTPGMAATDIEDLDLKARAIHCLKRANMTTLGDLASVISCSKELEQYRNLGKKTAREIMLALLFYQYAILPPDRRKAYMRDFYELNRKADTENG